MPEALKKLINVIWFLPWIGEKSAAKLAFFILKSNDNYIENFSDAVSWIKEHIWECKKCHSLVDLPKEKCSICLDEARDSSLVIIVEDFLDLIAIEQTWIHKGQYHVLGGAISPINGVFAADLNVGSLIKRIDDSDEKIELIMWTNPNIEWEATISYIKEQIDKEKLNHKVVITKLSRGLSSGYIEYADNITLVSALRDRKEVK